MSGGPKPERPSGADPSGLPSLPRILDPDEWDQARQMSAKALGAAPFPHAPPAYKASPADDPPPGHPSLATATADPPANVFERALAVLMNFGRSAMHDPLGTVAGVLTAPIESFGKLVGPTPEEAKAMNDPNSLYAQRIRAKYGIDIPVTGVTPHERLVAGVQTAANLAAGPIAGKVAGLVGGTAGKIIGGMAGGAPVGAAYNPEDPAAGALAMAAVGGASHVAAEGVKAVIGGEAAPSAAPGGVQTPEAQAEATQPTVPGMERTAEEQGLANREAAGRESLRAQAKADQEALRTQARGQMQADRDQARGVVMQHVDQIADSFRTMFAPASRSPEAGEAAGILRATTGEMAAQYEQAAYKLDEFRRAIEPMPEADKLGFIDAIEGGKSQASPEFQKAADTMREILDNGRKAVQALGTGKLEHFIEDYFPHIWKDADKASDAFKSAGGTRPMEGSKSFLKQRTIPTTAEGMAMGLEPVSTNPVDLTLLKLREMQRYVMAHQSLTEMKDAGLVTFVRAGDLPPDGYKPINDKIATVFGPRQGAVSLPEGAAKGLAVNAETRDVSVPPGANNVEPMAPEDVTVHGMRIMGAYHAPETVATVVNNYLSPGLRGNAIYDAFRGAGNTLNQAQLGLSAFHLMFTSMDASVSRAALGLEHIASGAPAEGFKALVSAPLAPVTNLRLGARIRSAYLDPANAPPDMQALANAVKDAGGRVRMDSFYQNSAIEKMVDAWREGTPGGFAKAAGYSLPAFFEAAAKPIMEHVVPLQKLGVFGDLAKKALADLPPDATLADRRAELGRAWDSVDNRMGQLVYDNLFWNKTTKDLAMASVRSVGWNIGTIRELGGGIGDVLGSAKDLATGSPTELTHRAAYVIALPLTVGMYGAAYQYLRTGKGPEELKDYFYPKTGETDADGNAERVQIASYMKDLFAYAGAPWQTVKHKVSPLLSAAYEMLQNQDFYGDEIRNPEDPAVKQLQQEAQYMIKTAEPFAFRNMQETGKRGDQSTATKLGTWFGITPAPRSAVRSDAQNKMADYLSSRGVTGRTPEDVEAAQTRSEIISGLRGNTSVDLDKAVTDAIERHQLTSADVVKLLKRAGSTPAQEKFKRLTLPQAIDVFQRGTDREKALFSEALIAKVERAGKKSNLAEAQQ